MADLTLPAAKSAGESGHVGVHAAILTALTETDERLDTLEAGGGSHTHAATDITSGLLGVADAPAGSQIVVDKVKNGGTWPARPTARTDVTVKWIGDTDPSTAAINGDTWLDIS